MAKQIGGNKKNKQLYKRIMKYGTTSKNVARKIRRAPAKGKGRQTKMANLKKNSTKKSRMTTIRSRRNFVGKRYYGSAYKPQYSGRQRMGNIQTLYSRRNRTSGRLYAGKRGVAMGSAKGNHLVSSIVNLTDISSYPIFVNELIPFRHVNAFSKSFNTYEQLKESTFSDVFIEQENNNLLGYPALYSDVRCDYINLKLTSAVVPDALHVFEISDKINFTLQNATIFSNDNSKTLSRFSQNLNSYFDNIVIFHRRYGVTTIFTVGEYKTMDEYFPQFFVSIKEKLLCLMQAAIIKNYSVLPCIITWDSENKFNLKVFDFQSDKPSFYAMLHDSNAYQSRTTPVLFSSFGDIQPRVLSSMLINLDVETSKDLIDWIIALSNINTENDDKLAFFIVEYLNPATKIEAGFFDSFSRLLLNGVFKLSPVIVGQQIKIRPRSDAYFVFMISKANLTFVSDVGWKINMRPIQKIAKSISMDVTSFKLLDPQFLKFVKRYYPQYFTNTQSLAITCS